MQDYNPKRTLGSLIKRPGMYDAKGKQRKKFARYIDVAANLNVGYMSRHSGKQQVANQLQGLIDKNLKNGPVISFSQMTEDKKREIEKLYLKPDSKYKK